LINLFSFPLNFLSIIFANFLIFNRNNKQAEEATSPETPKQDRSEDLKIDLTKAF